MVLSEREQEDLCSSCKDLPPAKGMYLEDDFIRNLFLTVIDFQMNGKAVERAIEFYCSNHWDEVRTLNDLKLLLSQHPDDESGNTRAAQYLWNYRLWTRVGLLRRLIEYFDRRGVRDQESLRDWAEGSQFKRDFEGKIKGMGIAIYNWLVMRQGVETVKPDVHLHRFVEAVVDRAVSDEDLVAALEQVAVRLDVKAYELDWRIWEHQRGEGLQSWMA